MLIRVVRVRVQIETLHECTVYLTEFYQNNLMN